ncbi:MAG: cytidine deaminase [Trueperaceae bacterium]|nr:cytidine deaminase [Trueperaceae bacterium]
MALVVPEDLLNAAIKVRLAAYTPFSNFKVGAALLSETGRILVGANVENSSYGLTRCAEQSAVLAMVSSGERGFEAIVVYTDTDIPTTPCGACRQILYEFSPKAHVFSVASSGDVLHSLVSDLLPNGFTLDDPLLKT